MNPNDDKLEREARRLEAQIQPASHLDELLAVIPSDTPYTALTAHLRPLWDALCKEDEITASLFINKSVKEYFGLKKSDLKPFHRAYFKLKKAHDSEAEETKKKHARTVLLDRDINSSEAMDAIAKIGIVDRNVFDLVIATYVAARLRTLPPIWLMLVGAPSSFKTELVRLVDLPEIYSLDTLSENAFASGYIMPDGSDPDDLLPLLDGKCFVIKDLTTIFSLKEDTIKKILGDMTSIFDGKFQKFTATRGEISYSAQFSMVACITPAILSKHHRYMHQLGGRFFFVRIPELTQETLKQGYAIAWDASNRETRIKTARQIISTYCHRVSEKAMRVFPSMQPEPTEIQEWFNVAADFIARARGTTMTRSTSFQNEKDEKITYYEVSDPQIEHPWRILNQLQALARTLAAMRGRTLVTEEEQESLKPIILSSMPIDRAVVVAELLKEDRLLVREIAERIEKSTKTVGRDLKELAALGLLLVEEINDPKIAKDAKGYSLKPEYKAFLTDIKTPEVPF